MKGELNYVAGASKDVPAIFCIYTTFKPSSLTDKVIWLNYKEEKRLPLNPVDTSGSPRRGDINHI